MALTSRSSTVNETLDKEFAVTPVILFPVHRYIDRVPSFLLLMEKEP